MSTGLYSHTTRAVGTVLTASIYNADHTNHITNANPSQHGGYSDSVAQMKTQTTPGGLGSESLASSLAAELERLRYVIARIAGTTYWYETPITGVGKHTMWIPAGAMRPRITNGPSRNTYEMTTNKNIVDTLDFDPSTQEYAQFDVRMPKSWNESTVTFKALWSHPATTTNFGVVWQLDGVAISDDDTFDVAFGTAQTVTDTGGTTNDLYQSAESSAITIAGSPAAEDLVSLRVSRKAADASDTLAVDARLHGIALFFTIDALTDA